MATLGRGDADIAEVRSLLRQGASPNARNWDGNTLTALMIAVQEGWVDIVKLLLDKGAKVNVKAAYVSGVEAHVLDGITALAVAASSGNLSIVKMLVERGADIHALDSYGKAVLAYAASNEVAQFFLDRGLDINARDKEGSTLLIRSAEGYQRPSIAFLLKHGADPNARTTDGTTALKLAQSVGHTLDVELLKEAGARE
ncbi:MAG TPA: ankyrin repeat domain-containing protein [Bryobacteraceae bacterium]|nr:ankyrin repeat domain-containing protein [Bryobacteraceae bacterium]